MDANGKTLGRLATQIADMLRGKRKPEYTPHIDTGDFVVVVNAEKIHVSGNKRQDKRYYRHSGYPGGLRSRTFEEMQARRPEEIIRLAVKGHDAAQPPGAEAADQAQDLRGARAPARGPAAANRRDRGVMADEQTPQDAEPGAEETPQHAVPGEDAAQIAGSAEDAALEAAQEAQEAGGQPAPRARHRRACRRGARGADRRGAGDRRLGRGCAARGGAGGERGDAAGEQTETPREKPAVPGAHLEVDIVPEGVDPLGREEQQYADPYAIEEEAEQAQAAEEQSEQEEPIAEPISTAAIDLASGARYRATGKRKTAIARVTLRPGTGTYLVNGRALDEHFPRNTLQRNIRQPLETVGYQDRMDVVARLHGGGISAQAGALRHGVSRALLEADPNLRGELKRRGFLTRDSRAKERKKAGLKKARKRPQFSKR